MMQDKAEQETLSLGAARMVALPSCRAENKTRNKSHSDHENRKPTQKKPRTRE